MTDIKNDMVASEDELDDGPMTTFSSIKLSRRNFIKRIIASGATVSASGYIMSACSNDSQQPAPKQQAAAPAPKLKGSIERMITLNVNGKDRHVDVLPNETLAMTLRYKLGLTGSKLGCDRGECGACTVLLDDVNVYSCSTLTHTVRNRKVVTIEGLEGADGTLHPVQQAFIDELGPQCGFCTPGQVMSAVALLKANPHPTREEARLAMSGNLCRCGAYDNYLNSIMAAAKMNS